MTDRLIHIVGPQNSRNNNLVLFLETEMETKCLHTPELNHAHIVDSPRHLILWDSQGCSLEDLWDWLEAREEKQIAPPLIALLNVFPGTTIKKCIVDQGVRGVFFDDDSPEMILNGVLGILDGKLWFSREIMTALLLQPTEVVEPPKNNAENNLTDREKEILAHIASGANNNKIADELCISSHTVKSHIYSVFKKINVTGRLEAALWAAEYL